MKVSPSKENILKKIRQALAQPAPLPFPQSEGTESVFQSPLQEELAIQFAENFSATQGRFSFCLNHEELLQQLQTLFQLKKWENIYCAEAALQTILHSGSIAFTDNDITNSHVAITSCEFLIARTGSIMYSTAKNGRISSVYSPAHICIANTLQLVYDVKDALIRLHHAYHSFPSSVSVVTGPSRTADIEKTLVTGVHGPKEIYCFLLEA